MDTSENLQANSPEDFIARLQASVMAQNGQDNVGVSARPAIRHNPFEDVTRIEWIRDLPAIGDGEFFIDVPWPSSSQVQPLPLEAVSRVGNALEAASRVGNALEAASQAPHTILFCVCELEWHVAMDIEAGAFRQGEDHVFYSGEYEKRETLSRAIKWVADADNRQFLDNHDGQILSHLEHEVAEALWDKYNPLTTLGADEAAAIYTSAKLYFTGQAQSHPVPSLVKEVDMFHKRLASMTRAELRSVKALEMEKINLITMAREEAMVTASRPKFAVPQVPGQPDAAFLKHFGS